MTLAAERLVRHPFAAWFYGDSIGFEGLLAASELLEDGRYGAFAYGFLRGWAARDQPYRPDDNTAPGHALCAIVERTGDKVLLDAGRRLADHLAARRRVDGVGITFEDARRSLRPPYGSVTLPLDEVAILNAPGAGIYVDCLHFDPPFFAHLASLTGEPAWAVRAIEEALGYVRLLADPVTGLFHHFWLEQTGAAYGLGWGRGQGWALLGLLDVVEFTTAATNDRDRIVEAVVRLAEAMLRTQQPDGGWAAIAQRSESGKETSTAAFMAIAFWRGIALGVLDDARFGVAAERAWSATWAAVDDEGLLAGVSAAVYSSTAIEHYAHVPRGFDVPWGQGPLLVAARHRPPSTFRGPPTDGR